MTTRRVSPAGAAATVAAALVVIAGLLTLGMPSHARERRMDALRVDDLSGLSRAIDAFWAKHSSLPPTLDSLVAARQLDRVPSDPQNNTQYAYLVSGERSYRLCATFDQPSDTNQAPVNIDVSSHSWRHGAGESCFDLTPPQKESK